MISSGMPCLVSLATPRFLRVSSRSLQKDWLWSGEWKREKSRDILIVYCWRCLALCCIVLMLMRMDEDVDEDFDRDDEGFYTHFAVILTLE